MSDAGGTIAQGLKLLASTGSQTGDAAAIAELARQHEAFRIVIGLPGNLNGTVGPRAQRVMALAGNIRKVSDIPVELWDERFSTNEAHRIFDMASVKQKKRKDVIDVMTAQIILQGYLDAQGHT